MIYEAAGSITVRVPLAIRRRPGRKMVVTPVQAGPEVALPTRADPALVKALARAFRYQRLLDDGRYTSISEMAEGEKIERGYLGTLLRLTLLAPDIIEALLDGRQPTELALPALLKPFPADWARQRVQLFSARWSAEPTAPQPPAAARTEAAPLPRLEPPSSQHPANHQA
jgi:hypothetical protein